MLDLCINPSSTILSLVLYGSTLQRCHTVVIPTDFHDCQAQLVSCLKENEGVQGQLRELVTTLPSRDALDQQASKHKDELKQVQMNAFALVESAEQCVVRTEKIAQSKIRDVGMPRALLMSSL